MRAYQAYGDSVFLEVANIVYDFGSKFIISYNNSMPSNSNKQFTVAIQCSGSM